MKWLPIEHYDKLKKKPKNCVFYFKELKSPRGSYADLPATTKLSRHFGERVCTAYCVIEDVPEEFK